MSWGSGLEQGPEEKAEDGTVTGLLHRIMQWPCAWVLSPMKGAWTGTTATALLSAMLHCQPQGQIQLRMGWGWLGKKEKAEAHPAWWCDCKGSCSFIDEL